MKRSLVAIPLLVLLVVSCVPALGPQSFTLEQVMIAPFPSDLTASKTGNRIAWVLDEQGKRNVWVAEGPYFKSRCLSSSPEDDGQEISSLSFSADGNTL